MKAFKFIRLISKFFLACGLICIGLIGESNAQTYYVSPAGSDANPGIATQPFQTIQKAADIVNPGDVVIVEDGTYTASAGKDRIVNLKRGGKSDQWITFRSLNKWGAVLDGQNNQTTYCWNLGTGASYTRVENFELTGCQKGIWSNANAHHITLYGNRIHHMGRMCTGTKSGNGPAVFQGSNTSHHTFDSNVIHDNGRFATGENGCDNEAENKKDPNWCSYCYQNHDHGFYINNTTDDLIVNNLFYRNTRGWDLSIDRSTSNTIIISNTFADPNPYRDGHVLLYGAGGSRPNNANITIENNIFFHPRNAAIRLGQPEGKKNIVIKNNLIYGAGEVTSPGSGSLTNEYTIEDNIIGQDPLFADFDSDNFNLSAGSPAIDAGTLQGGSNVDILGTLRPQGAGVDIGAYEAKEQAACDGDLSGDKLVNVADLQIMVNVLLGVNLEEICADLNSDGNVSVVDLQDLIIQLLE